MVVHRTSSIQGIAEMSPTLTSLDVSHNGATGLISALCDKLKGNRSLTALKLCGNNIDFEGVQLLRKFFGGVNSQSGVLWGNKTLVALDVPSKGFQEDVQRIMTSYQSKVRQGQQDMARGQSVIKSAYKPDYRRPNQARKAAGIQQKVAGKKAIASAQKDMGKLKTLTEEIGQMVLRNQNIMSLKEQPKVTAAAGKAAVKQAAKVERQRSQFQTMVATKRAKRLAAWDAAMGKVSSVRVMLCRFERLPSR